MKRSERGTMQPSDWLISLSPSQIQCSARFNFSFSDVRIEIYRLSPFAQRHYSN